MTTSGIQSFHFNKDTWTLAEATKWLRLHEYRTTWRVDTAGSKFYAFRQKQPGRFKRIWKVRIKSRSFGKMLYMLRGYLI